MYKRCFKPVVELVRFTLPPRSGVWFADFQFNKLNVISNEISGTLCTRTNVSDKVYLIKVLDDEED